jgi:hypothetical protein
MCVGRDRKKEKPFFYVSPAAVQWKNQKVQGFIIMFLEEL